MPDSVTPGTAVDTQERRAAPSLQKDCAIVGVVELVRLAKHSESVLIAGSAPGEVAEWRLQHPSVVPSIGPVEAAADVVQELHFD